MGTEPDRCGKWTKCNRRRRATQVINGPNNTHLHAVHLILADHLDGDLSPLARGISSTVHVAEGAVAHLVRELPSLQAGVLGEPALAGILFGDELGEVVVVDALGFGGLVRVGGRLGVGLDGFGGGGLRLGSRLGLTFLWNVCVAGLFACRVSVSQEGKTGERTSASTKGGFVRTVTDEVLKLLNRRHSW